MGENGGQGCLSQEKYGNMKKCRILKRRREKFLVKFSVCVCMYVCMYLCVGRGNVFFYEVWGVLQRITLRSGGEGKIDGKMSRICAVDVW